MEQPTVKAKNRGLWNPLKAEFTSRAASRGHNQFTQALSKIVHDEYVKSALAILDAVEDERNPNHHSARMILRKLARATLVNETQAARSSKDRISAAYALGRLIEAEDARREGATKVAILVKPDGSREVYKGGEAELLLAVKTKTDVSIGLRDVYDVIEADARSVEEAAADGATQPTND